LYFFLIFALQNGQLISGKDRLYILDFDFRLKKMNKTIY